MEANLGGHHGLVGSCRWSAGIGTHAGELCGYHLHLPLGTLFWGEDCDDRRLTRFRLSSRS